MLSPEDMVALNLPVPRDWKDSVRSAYFQAVSLAHTALSTASALAQDCGNLYMRQSAREERLEQENNCLREQLDLFALVSLVSIP